MKINNLEFGIMRDWRHIILVFSLTILFVSCSKHQNVVEQTLSQGWTLTGDTLNINLPVNVPSVVQQNLYDAGLIPHPYLDLRSPMDLRHPFQCGSKDARKRRGGIGV